MQHLFTELWPLKRDSEPPSREREFSHAVISCGSKSGVTNSKKNWKNLRPSHGVILCDLITEKKFKPRVRPFSRNPLHKNDIPLQGYMVFMSNELGQGPDPGIVCWNEAILDTRVSIGTSTKATKAVFYFVPRKACFPFLKYRNRNFMWAGYRNG
jgi:hypothetical protein